MRIEKVIIESFKGIKKITTSLNNGMFYICGMNESGKSSFLDGLTFALLGKKAFPMGKWKEITATSGSKTLTSLVLVDDDGKEVLTITRKVSKSNNESVVIQRSDGKLFSQSDLNRLLEPISLNPKAFMEMSAKEQALFLGIDTADLDAQYKEVEQERRFIGRDVKRLEGACDEIRCENPGEPINFSETSNLIIAIDNGNMKISSLENEIDELKIRIEEKNRELKLQRDQLPTGNILELKRGLNDAVELNGKVHEYKNYLKFANEYEIAAASYQNRSDKLEAIKAKKVQAIKSAKLPFKNLATNDSGELVVIKDGKEMPFNAHFFSTGKMWEMSIKIISAKNPELKTIIVKDATLLDAEKIKHITKVAQDKGLQVLMEFVGESQGENSITLVEGELDVV